MEIPEEMGERAQELDIRVYTGAPNEDLMLLNLWMELTENGEIKSIMTPEYLSPSKFISAFQWPKNVLYALNEDGKLSYLCWFSPMSEYLGEKTVFVSLWSRKGFAGTKRSILLGSLTVELLFLQYDYIMGVNWDTRRHKIFQHMGYEIITKVPSLYGIDNVYFILMNKENFYNSGLYSAKLKLERR
jgi:hypothetical protein